MPPPSISVRPRRRIFPISVTVSQVVSNGEKNFIWIVTEREEAPSHPDKEHLNGLYGASMGGGLSDLGELTDATEATEATDECVGEGADDSDYSEDEHGEGIGMVHPAQAETLEDRKKLAADDWAAAEAAASLEPEAGSGAAVVNAHGPGPVTEAVVDSAVARLAGAGDGRRIAWGPVNPLAAVSALSPPASRPAGADRAQSANPARVNLSATATGAAGGRCSFAPGAGLAATFVTPPERSPLQQHQLPRFDAATSRHGGGVCVRSGAVAAAGSATSSLSWQVSARTGKEASAIEAVIVARTLLESRMELAALSQSSGILGRGAGGRGTSFAREIGLGRSRSDLTAVERGGLSAALGRLSAATSAAGGLPPRTEEAWDRVFRGFERSLRRRGTRAVGGGSIAAAGNPQSAASGAGEACPAAVGDGVTTWGELIRLSAPPLPVQGSAGAVTEAFDQFGISTHLSQPSAQSASGGEGGAPAVAQAAGGIVTADVTGDGSKRLCWAAPSGGVSHSSAGMSARLQVPMATDSAADPSHPRVKWQEQGHDRSARDPNIPDNISPHFAEALAGKAASVGGFGSPGSMQWRDNSAAWRGGSGGLSGAKGQQLVPFSSALGGAGTGVVAGGSEGDSEQQQEDEIRDARALKVPPSGR